MTWTDSGWAMRHWRVLELSFLGGLFAACVAVRGANLSVLVAAPDELTYAARAFYILGANWAWPYFTMWDQPPLFEYILALVTVTSGAALDTLRWVSVVMGSLTVVAGYYLAKSLYGRVAAVVAALVIAVNPFEILYSRQAYIEATVSTLMLFALYLFWEGVMKRRDNRLTILGGVVFGLALDSKYITLVMAVAIVVFIILYKGRIQGGVPWRGLLIYFGVGILAFVPVLLDLAVNNVNPFYFDLVGRFQSHGVGDSVAKAVSLGGGIAYIGFRNFIQTFIRFSEGDLFSVYPPSLLDIPVWMASSIFVFAFFVWSFFYKRTPREGMLMIVFVALLGFAFSYPGKRSYFTLYPMLIFVIMLGGLVQLSVEWIRAGRKGRVMKVLAATLIVLTITGTTINAFALPLSQKQGFGDWDEITPIISYIGANAVTNSSVAISLTLIGYYIEHANLNVSITWMLQQQFYFSETPANQSLQSPLEGHYPNYKVISLAIVERTNPQFIVIPALYLKATPQAFQQYLNAHYYQPLYTQRVLLFQIRPGG